MLVEVVINGWEQGCCGASFRVGDQMTWKLHATVPAEVPEGALTGFEEEHHDLTPEEAPQWNVLGVVVAIAGISYPLLPITGQPGSFTWDTENPHDTALASVEEPADPVFDQYRVLFDVADDTDLPPYAPEEAHRQGEFDTVNRELQHERMHDEIGVLLETFAEQAQRRYGNAADVTRASDRSAVTAEPHRAGATAINWARSSEANDGITVTVGDGTWLLPATAATAANAGLVGEFLEAAADGALKNTSNPGKARIDNW